jgi:hypothetical protein|tara:strand:- start:1575 stop:1790 length:216 start_codon:yes stop_codon:yes gene_type:complete
MDIKLWYSKNMKQWRWSLLDPMTGKQQSGQQFHLKDAMGDVATTVEYLIKDGYDGEIEDSGRRIVRSGTVD